MKKVWKLLRDRLVFNYQKMSQTERIKSKDVVEEYWSTGNKCHKYMLALETFNLLFPPWKWLVTPRQLEPLCFMPNSAKCPDFRAHDN